MLRALCLTGMAVAIAWAGHANSAQANGKRDALNPQERQAAAERVRSSMGAAMNKRQGQTQTQRANSAGADPLQLLLVERRPSKSGTQRLADVFHYDYDANELVHCVVDIETDEVIRADRQPGVQLPLVDAEIKRATEIVMNTKKARRKINRAYRQITGRPLNSINDIDYKAFVYHADSTLIGGGNRSRACGNNRCAQVLLYTDDNVALDLSPIVDLSQGQVTDILRPEGAPISIDPQLNQ